MLILVTGGSGSGKSEYAEGLCTRLGIASLTEADSYTDKKIENKRKKLTYIATMEPYGEEGQKRIARHHTLRAGKGFKTLERYTDIQGLCPAEDLGGTVLLECLSNLVANEMFSSSGCGPESCQEKILQGIAMIAGKTDNLIVVSNQIFSDGIEYDPGTMEYMEILGRLNAALADRSDAVVEVVAGIPMFLKGREQILKI